MDDNFGQNSESDFEIRNHEIPYPKITENMKKIWDQNGFIIIRNLLTADEMTKLAPVLLENDNFWSIAYNRNDGTGKQFDMVLWNYPGQKDFLAILAGSAKTAGISEQLLNKGELYLLYHGKLLRKSPKIGGAVEWHQDYGYWYNNGTLFPDFVTCLVALTKSDQSNGGLEVDFLKEVLKGSHLCGRIVHNTVGTQKGADFERVALIEKHLEKVSANLGPGDAVFFHSNLLHKSGPNLSDEQRIHLIFSYNTKDNSPVTEQHHAVYNKLIRYPADALENCDFILERRQYMDTNRVTFWK